MPERQPQRLGLNTQSLGTNRAHGDTLEGLVYRGEEADNLNFPFLAKDVKPQGAVLAAFHEGYTLGSPLGESAFGAG